MMLTGGIAPEEGHVPAYRFYLLDPGGRVTDVRDASCEDDATAEAVARELVAGNRAVASIETWLRPRLISKVGRADVVSDSAYAGARPISGR